MSEKPRPQDEPSIEEILGSIRRIIAEDEEPSKPSAQAEPDDEEPLELTNKIDPDGTISQQTPVAEEKPQPIAEPVVEEKMVVDDIDALFSQPSQAPEPEPAPVPEIKPEPVAVAPVAAAPPAPAVATPANIVFEEPTPVTQQNDENLLSENTAAAASAVMAKLARHTVVTDKPGDATSLEGMVRDMLKPLLREWLDNNLPDMVQKMVERELDKLSKRV